jgi:hypothetical protein
LHGKRTRETNNLEERGGAGVTYTPTRRASFDVALLTRRQPKVAFSRSERRRSGARIGASRNSQRHSEASGFEAETSCIRPEGATTNQPRASPGDHCNAFAPALKGRNIANPLLRPFRACFPREFPFPGRCPGLICSAPSGRNPKQRNIKTRKRGKRAKSVVSSSEPSLARRVSVVSGLGDVAR